MTALKKEVKSVPAKRPAKKKSTAQSEAAARQPAHDEIAALAAQYWEERGRPEGSPESDWFRAEHTLTHQA